MSKKTNLTWEDIKQDCKTLADSLSKENITCIIGIANGGMIPATLLAKHLKVDKLLSANLKSYVDDKPRDGAHSETDVVKLITFPDFGTLRDEEKILIVDSPLFFLVFKLAIPSYLFAYPLFISNGFISSVEIISPYFAKFSFVICIGFIIFSFILLFQRLLF